MLPWALEESEVPESRRERKKSRTHDDLVAAATQLFATNGYEQTSIEQITELVDVSPRTFFRHFGSKDLAGKKGACQPDANVGSPLLQGKILES